MQLKEMIVMDLQVESRILSQNSIEILDKIGRFSLPKNSRNSQNQTLRQAFLCLKAFLRGFWPKSADFHFWKSQEIWKIETSESPNYHSQVPEKGFWSFKPIPLTVKECRFLAKTMGHSPSPDVLQKPYRLKKKQQQQQLWRPSRCLILG